MIIINPPNPPGFVSNKDTMGGFGQLYSFGTETKIPPIDIAYIASVLKNNGISFGVIDCLGNNWELSELIIQLREQKPDIIGIRTSTPTFDWDIKLAKIIKMVTESKIIFFGPHVTIFPEQALSYPFVDAVVLGEPEFTFLDIVERGGFNGCAGVWFRDGNEVMRNKDRDLIEDLDKLPFPAWDLMPYEKYSAAEFSRNIRPFVTVQASRGCPFGCFYCPYHITQGCRLRVRSSKNVVDELEWLVRTLGVKAVLFRDPEFALVRQRIVDMCSDIIKRGIRLSWRCETRLVDLDDELLELMAQAGCIGINIGIESADKDVLKKEQRDFIPLKAAKRIIQACRRYDIETYCFFILGLPADTKKTILKTIRYALRLSPVFIQFTVANPYPGTALRAWAESKGYIENRSLEALTGFEVVMRNESLTTKEIRLLRWFAYEAWDMQWQKLLKRVLRNFRNILSEFRRWLIFEKARFKRIPYGDFK